MPKRTNINILSFKQRTPVITTTQNTFSNLPFRFIEFEYHSQLDSIGNIMKLKPGLNKCKN
uniref:Uncharacterized protein n=1 Tax=Megaviridae environmental sample TaxID=1737588 RepID=A0A5J6VIY1_9VIRU|nr:MAG: hypothetical protein [Megaviridae environmental sample]